MADKGSHQAYVKGLETRFRRYQYATFEDLSVLELGHRSAVVFDKQFKHLNVISNPAMSPERVMKSVAPAVKLHRWFGSMRSSQALAISVFGNLKYYKKLRLLANLSDDDGKQLFPVTDTTDCYLEHTVDYLGELPGRETNVDVFFDGDYRIAVECKLAEPEIGECSRPKLGPKDDNYQQDYCDGSYTVQRGRNLRCSLSCRGIRYWDYVPAIFDWVPEVDYSLCPLLHTYQLARNILAASVRRDGSLDASSCHVVLLYDERNPEFWDNGRAMRVWAETRECLRAPSILRRCSWQRVTEELRKDKSLSWLTDGLADKYGF